MAEGERLAQRLAAAGGRDTGWAAELQAERDAERDIERAGSPQDQSDRRPTPEPTDD